MSSITIRELAALAGCSHATVSLALKNHPRISQATREKITRLAEEHGYFRDPVVSQLMNQLRAGRHGRPAEKLVYLNLWDNPDEAKRGYHDRTCYAEACARARALGYEIEEFWAKEPGLSAQRISRILYHRSVRGLIVGAPPRPSSHISLQWEHFATVAIGATMVKPDVHRVVHSHFQGMQLTLRSLKHRGYQRVAFTSLHDQSERSNQGWLACYLLHSHRLPAKARIPPLVVTKWDAGKMRQWLEKYRPDAVVSNHDEPLNLLRELGCRVPGEIGFASLDRILPSDPYAGIDQMRGRCGASAVDLLVSLVETNQFGLPEYPKTLSIDGVWRDGPTVRGKGRM